MLYWLSFHNSDYRIYAYAMSGISYETDILTI